MHDQQALLGIASSDCVGAQILRVPGEGGVTGQRPERRRAAAQDQTSSRRPHRKVRKGVRGCACTYHNVRRVPAAYTEYAASARTFQRSVLTTVARSCSVGRVRVVDVGSFPGCIFMYSMIRFRTQRTAPTARRARTGHRKVTVDDRARHAPRASERVIALHTHTPAVGSALRSITISGPPTPAWRGGSSQRMPTRANCKARFSPTRPNPHIRPCSLSPSFTLQTGDGAQYSVQVARLLRRTAGTPLP